MLLNEIINEVGMTKRAVKYYEEKGLLSVDKDNNGYRNYTAQDVETLKKISVYRKLGISIKDIQSLLETGDVPVILSIKIRLGITQIGEVVGKLRSQLYFDRGYGTPEPRTKLAIKLINLPNGFKT